MSEQPEQDTRTQDEINAEARKQKAGEEPTDQAGEE